MKDTLNYDQVPEDNESSEVDPNCTYPKCGCPHFNC